MITKLLINVIYVFVMKAMYQTIKIIVFQNALNLNTGIQMLMNALVSQDLKEEIMMVHLYVGKNAQKEMLIPTKLLVLTV